MNRKTEDMGSWNTLVVWMKLTRRLHSSIECFEQQGQADSLVSLLLLALGVRFPWSVALKLTNFSREPKGNERENKL